MTCTQCGQDPIPGALLCDGCGAPLLSMPPQPGGVQHLPTPSSPTPPASFPPPPAPFTPPPASFAPPTPFAPPPTPFAPPPTPFAPPSAPALPYQPSSSSLLAVGARPTSGARRFHHVLNNERQPTGFAAPDDGQCLTLGRHDLEQGLVVEVDLRAFVEVQGEGYPISREQARVYRDPAGLWIEHLGRAGTLWRAAASPRFTPLSGGQPQRLSAGDRLFFGTSASGAMFELV